MPDHGIDAAIPQRRHERQHVSHEVQLAKREQVAVVGRVPTCRPAVASLVRRHDAIALGRERQHDLAPAVRQLRKAMQQQEQRPSRLSRFEDVHPHPVHVLHETRPDAVGKRAAKRWQISRHGASTFEYRGRVPRASTAGKPRRR